MTDTANIEIVCPGMLAGVLEVLSIGKGDLRLTVGGDDPDEIERARRIITDMLNAGYSIYVETEHGPIRVREFHAATMTYVITDTPEPAPDEIAAAVPSQKRAPRKSQQRRVPVAGSRATAVGRTAGG